ncbi:hypothetical protein BTJ40_21590 [Microbulbifer sp. A4B17]|uniref:amidohydrolase family protein n=1 Tax=Microbulbifer sp. A4B17 TaxID=359370 RepID=UPI000D52C76A|nr:amidohydrolase family protein [Microbulbifer sp. A4B17]AWF83200.1 hypothetical protein BTJ40_21590 [Microbulbifer sp. A4B17]
MSGEKLRGDSMRLACIVVCLMLIACERDEKTVLSGSPTFEPAQLILKNAYIYTVDPARSIASAMAIRDGRIVYVGTEHGVNKYIGVQTQINDLKGRLVLPGFIQSISNSTDYSGLDLFPFQSIEGYQNKIQDYILNNPEAQMVVGRGWRMEVFGAGEPHKAILDQINDLIPIIMFSADQSYVWTNSEAIAAAGIDMNTQSSTENLIKKSEDGIPVGLFQGRKAVNIFNNLIPEKPVKEEYLDIGDLEEFVIPRGVTTLYTVYIPFYESENKTQEYKKYMSSKDLDVRIRASVRVPIDISPERFKLLRNYADNISSDNFKINAISIVMPATGLTNSHSAQNQLGLTLKDASVILADLFSQANSHKFQVHFSVPVEDYSEGILKDQLDKLIKNDQQGLRNIISNIPEGLLDALLVRENTAAIIYENKMPTYNVDKLIGSGSSVMRNKILYFAGNRRLDGQAEKLNGVRGPISIIHTGTMYKVPVETMIQMLTIRGAYANHLEKETGSLEVGKWADFIILDRNLLKINPDEIYKTKVLKTYYKGRLVY